MQSFMKNMYFFNVKRTKDKKNEIESMKHKLRCKTFSSSVLKLKHTLLHLRQFIMFFDAENRLYACQLFITRYFPYSLLFFYLQISSKENLHFIFALFYKYQLNYDQ